VLITTIAGVLHEHAPSPRENPSSEIARSVIARSHASIVRGPPYRSVATGPFLMNPVPARLPEEHEGHEGQIFLDQDADLARGAS
jgi:hypothetical protein